MSYLADKADMIIQSLPEESQAIVREHFRTEVEKSAQLARESRMPLWVVSGPAAVLGVACAFMVLLRLLGGPEEGPEASALKDLQETHAATLRDLAVAREEATMYKNAVEALLKIQRADP